MAAAEGKVLPLCCHPKRNAAPEGDAFRFAKRCRRRDSNPRHADYDDGQAGSSESDQARLGCREVPSVRFEVGSWTHGWTHGLGAVSPAAPQRQLFEPGSRRRGYDQNSSQA